MKVSLTERDPHPDQNSRFVADWWGRDIEIDHAQRAKAPHSCGALVVCKILGPPELLRLLRKHSLGEYICSHMIGKVLNQNGHR